MFRPKLWYWSDSFPSTVEIGGGNPAWTLFLKEAFCEDLSVTEEGVLELKPHTQLHSFPCLWCDSARDLCLGRLGCADLARDLPVLSLFEECLYYSSSVHRWENFTAWEIGFVGKKKKIFSWVSEF